MVSWCFSGLFICLGSGQPIRRPSIFDAFYFDFLYLGGNWGVRFWSLPFEKTWAAGLGTKRSEIGHETRGSLGSNE